MAFDDLPLSLQQFDRVLADGIRRRRARRRTVRWSLSVAACLVAVTVVAALMTRDDPQGRAVATEAGDASTTSIAVRPSTTQPGGQPRSIQQGLAHVQAEIERLGVDAAARLAAGSIEVDVVGHGTFSPAGSVQLGLFAPTAALLQPDPLSVYDTCVAAAGAESPQCAEAKVAADRDDTGWVWLGDKSLRGLALYHLDELGGPPTAYLIGTRILSGEVAGDATVLATVARCLEESASLSSTDTPPAVCASVPFIG